MSPDGKHIISGCLDNTVKVWRLDTGEEEADPAVLAEKARLLDVHGVQGGVASSAPLSRSQGYPVTLGYGGSVVVDLLLSDDSAAPPMLLRGRVEE